VIGTISANSAFTKWKHDFATLSSITASIADRRRKDGMTFTERERPATSSAIETTIMTATSLLSQWFVT